MSRHSMLAVLTRNLLTSIIKNNFKYKELANNTTFET